ncbi:hypothetical protein NQ318_013613 [Aromia moschata]|uniref:Kinesin-like protein n=1 Tax=Aromia moschata TaxID=1265417 RepID=A0AAV8YJZ3_9CUCU|nr:hypothetical protein NQ318_013613 [Aromia moschata]
MATVIPAKKTKDKSTEKLQNVKVIVRVRPLNKVEEEQHVKTTVKCLSQREILTKEKKFYFDRVFKPETTQLEVYMAVVAPMIPDVIAGYNCTVFAYGQTGSGKTYTMTGDNCQRVINWRDDLVAGCVPRAAAHIFEELSAERSENNVKVSYLELYNEEIRDLLSDDESVLPVYDHCKHQREHGFGEDILKAGKINLVDLAGSENIARSGCKDVRAVELANINKSLLTLGRVIQALADKSQKHVPYRDSKLTRILQDSLGGHTKTAIIATVSPAAGSYEETTSTLDYASCGLLTEIDRLQKDLDAAHDKSGFYVNKDNYQKLIDGMEAVTGEKLTIEEIARKQSKRIEELEEILAMKIKEFDETVELCKRNKEMLAKAKAVIKEKKACLKQERYVSQTYEAQANQLQKEVKNLVSTAEQLSQESGILHDKLEKQYDIIITNESTARTAIAKVFELLDKVTADNAKLMESDSCVGKQCREDVNDLKQSIEESLESVKRAIDKFNKIALDKVILREPVKAMRDKYIETIKNNVVEMKRQLEQHCERLERFETTGLLKFLTNFQETMKHFAQSVHDMAVRINCVLGADDLNISKGLEKLEMNLLIRKEEEEIIFKNRVQRDNEILGQITALKELVNTRRGIREEGLLRDMGDLMEETQLNVNTLSRTFRQSFFDIRRSAPGPPRAEEIGNVACKLSSELRTLDENTTTVRGHAETLGSMTVTVSDAFINISSVLESKVESVHSRLDFLMDDTETIQKTFNNLAKETNKILTDEFLEKVVPVTHEGDTPQRNTVSLPRITTTHAPQGATHREVQAGESVARQPK